MNANNTLHLIGHLGDDAKFHAFENGGSIVSFPLAFDTSYKPKDKDKVERTDWIECKREFGSENLATVLTKGKYVALAGRIRQRSYENSEGKKIYEHYMEVEDIVFLDKKPVNA